METDGRTGKSCRERETCRYIYIYGERDSYCQVDRDGKRRQMMGQRETDGRTTEERLEVKEIQMDKRVNRK